MLRAGGPAVAQAGVLGGSRVQLENGLARTKAKADLGAGGAAPLYPGFIPGGSDDLRWAARKKAPDRQPRNLRRGLTSLFKRGIRRLQACLQRLVAPPPLWGAWLN